MLSYDILDDVFKLRNVIDDFFTEAPVRRGRREFPYVQMFSGTEELEVRAFVPGIEVDDLNIQIADNSLILEGKKKEDYQKDGAYLRKERAFGEFKKSIKLPYQVDVNKIKADLINGVLIVKLSKSDDAKPKKIEIN